MKKAKLNLLIGMTLVFSFLAPVIPPTCLLSAQDEKPEPYFVQTRDDLLSNETYAVLFTAKGESYVVWCKCHVIRFTGYI